MFQTYRSRLLFFCAVLGAFFIATQTYSFKVSQKVVTRQLENSVVNAANLLNARIVAEKDELERYTTILSNNKKLKEYLFIIVEFDSGRDIMDKLYREEYGWLPVYRTAIISHTGETILGAEHEGLVQRLKANPFTKNAFYRHHEQGIELVSVTPIRYKGQLMGQIALTQLYSGQWLNKFDRMHSSHLVIEKDNRILQTTFDLDKDISFDQMRNGDGTQRGAYRYYRLELENADPGTANIWVAFSAAEFTRRLQEYRSTVIMVTLGGTLIIIAFCWLITRRFSRPLEQLAMLTTEISRGRYPEITKSSPKNEIETLTNQFADMVAALRRKEDEVRKAHDQLEQSAVTDALTGIPNRRAFEERLDKIVRHARYGHKTYAVCFIDLDQFKIVNDSCGHQAGDQLLSQVTSLLNSRIRGADILARIGGDEFGLILMDVDKKLADRVAHDLLGIIKDFRFCWQNKLYEIGASIGVVLVDQSTTDANEVLSQADLACYSAKNSGRNCVFFYERQHEGADAYREEINWIEQIRSALEEDRFALWAQPIVGIGRSNKKPFYELLIRLIKEDGEVVLPGAFLSAAERYNITPSIDRWVIHKSIEYLSRLEDRDIMFFINLSALSIAKKDTFIQIQEALKNWEVNPASVCFEITETSAIHNLSHAIEMVQELKKLGCHFALDDFGAGLSSFRYLKHLPVDYLKIDGGYVKNIDKTVEDLGMLEAIHKIAHLTGKKTVAECVENEAVFAKLRQVGVDYCQGFYTGRPQPLESLFFSSSADKLSV